MGNLAWAWVRIVFGLSMAFFHGYAKVFQGGAARLAGGVEQMGLPFPTFLAWCAAVSEFVGGLLLAVGLATRPAASFIGITMLVALYRHRVDPWAKSELALLYLAVMVATLMVGGGKYSLDAQIQLRLPWRSRGPST